MKQQLVTSGEDEVFIAEFYGREANKNISAHKRETDVSYLVPPVIPRNKGCAENLQKCLVVFLFFLWMIVDF